MSASTDVRQWCSAPPSEALLRAVAEFNAGDFYACHETLEALWMQEQGSVRDFYQGVLQVAVGHYHAARGNQRGAVLCFQRGLARLIQFGPVCRDMDIARLIVDAEEALARAQLEELERPPGDRDPNIALIGHEGRARVG